MSRTSLLLFIRKRNLKRQVEEDGFIMVSPCVRCAQLNKICIKSDDSSRCKECIRSSRKCVDSQPTFSDAEWRRLIQAQQDLRSKESQIQEEIELLMARSRRLRKQEQLLQRRAGDFISREIKEIEELEALEKQEEEERAQQEKERKAEEDRQRLIELLGLPPSSDEDRLTSAFSLPSGSSAVDPSLLAAFDQFVGDIPESSQDNSNA